MLKGISNWVNDKIFPPLMKFVNTKPMNALKNGIIYAMPFIIIGSIFLILSSFPYVPIQNYFSDTGWTAVFTQAYTASFGILSVWAVIGIAYSYVRDEGFEPLPAGLTAFSAFLIVQSLSIANPIVATMGKAGTGVSNAAGKIVVSGTQVASNIDKLPKAVQSLLASPVTGVLNITWLGGQGMIAAILIGILTGWGYSKMMKAGWKITLPEQVPANVAAQFTAMIPAGVIIVVSTGVFACFKFLFQTDFLSWIYKVLQTPLQGVSSSFIGVLIIAFLVPFFWFFGVHGGVIMGAVTSAVLIPNTFDNAAAFKAGQLTLSNPSVHIVTNEFYNNFINLTGSGITIGLLVFTLVGAHSVQFKSLGRVEAVPALFNINEPFLFGIPLVANPFLAIPFFLTPVVVAATTYGVIKFGIVPPLNGVAAPWTTPPIISGFLIGGWKMAIWQTVVLFISAGMYYPFARRYDKVLLKQETEKLASETLNNK